MSALPVSAQTVFQDLKYGFRQLRSHPGFTAVAVLTLALCIGVNTSIFSLLDSLMLRPLPVPHSAGMLEIYRGGERPCSYPDYLDFRQRVRAFSSLAADLRRCGQSSGIGMMAICERDGLFGREL